MCQAKDVKKINLHFTGNGFWPVYKRLSYKSTEKLIKIDKDQNTNIEKNIFKGQYRLRKDFEKQRWIGLKYPGKPIGPVNNENDPQNKSKYIKKPKTSNNFTRSHCSRL